PVLGFATANTNDGTGNNGSAQISIIYTADMNGATDCLGNAIAANGVVTNTYAVSRDPTTNLSRLTCNGQPIVEGVEDMQIQYGVDDANKFPYSGDGYPDYYVTATTLNANPNLWQQVVAVRV